MARVPNIVARIGLSSDTPRNFKYRFVLTHWVDHVVFVAAAMRKSHSESIPELDPRLTTIYKGIPPLGPRLTKGAARWALGVPGDVPLLGSVSRLVSQKRVGRLLEAMVFLHEDTHLAIAGDGPLRGALGQHARQLGLRQRVHFLGHQSNIATLIDAVDALVITSGREGMSGAMLKAMSRGVPVISTDVSGAREALDPETNGHAPGLVTGFAPPEIASAVNSVLYDRQVLEEMGQAAKERYREQFSCKRMLDGLGSCALRQCEPPPKSSRISPLPTSRSTKRSLGSPRRHPRSRESGRGTSRGPRLGHPLRFEATQPVRVGHDGHRTERHGRPSDDGRQQDA